MMTTKTKTKTKNQKPTSSFISILSYNILAPIYVRPIDCRTGQIQEYAAFSWADSSILDWDQRRTRIIQELMDSKSDVICLQEVQFEQQEAGNNNNLVFGLPQWLLNNLSNEYDYQIPSDQYLEEMSERNRRVLGKKIPIGNVLLWKKDRLQLVPEPTSSNKISKTKKKQHKQSTTRVTACLRSIPPKNTSSSSSSPFHLPPTLFACVHLDATDERKRAGQLMQCLNIARWTFGTSNVIIGGDFNSELRVGSILGRFLRLRDGGNKMEPTLEQMEMACSDALRLGTEDDVDNVGERKWKKPSKEQMEEWSKLHNETLSSIQETRYFLDRVPTGPTRSCPPHDYQLNKDGSSTAEKIPMIPWILDHILYTNTFSNSDFTLKLHCHWEALEADIETRDEVGTPNARCPSDHIPVAAMFEICHCASSQKEKNEGDGVECGTHLKKRKMMLEQSLDQVQHDQEQMLKNFENRHKSNEDMTNDECEKEEEDIPTKEGFKKKKKGKKEPPCEALIEKVRSHKMKKRALKRDQRSEREMFVDQLDFVELMWLDDILIRQWKGDDENEGCVELKLKNLKKAAATLWVERGELSKLFLMEGKTKK